MHAHVLQKLCAGTIIYSYFGIYKRVIPGEKLARKGMVGCDEAEDVRKKL